jgi:hypothetical protein
METLEQIDIEQTQDKLKQRIASLRKSMKKAKAKFVATLPMASELQLASILDRIKDYSTDVMSGVNEDFRLSDVQLGEIELALADFEESLNTAEGKEMVASSLRNAKRIKNFRVGKLKKKTNTIPVTASWEIAG